jgi:hypothetical protein
MGDGRLPVNGRKGDDGMTPCRQFFWPLLAAFAICAGVPAVASAGWPTVTHFYGYNAVVYPSPVGTEGGSPQYIFYRLAYGTPGSHSPGTGITGATVKVVPLGGGAAEFTLTVTVRGANPPS